MSVSRLYPKTGREKIGFAGVGRSTLGVYHLLYKRGFRDFIFRSEVPVSLPKGVNAGLTVGENAFFDVGEDILFLSPAVRSDRPQFRAAKARGTLLSSDCDLFFRESAGTVFAVTGSDGKSTTTTMLYSLLRSSAENVNLVGNIGVAFSPFLDGEKEGALYAAELSSFQLNDIKPCVKRAVITTLSPNHLDFHGGFDEYIEAKRHIYENAEEPVLNADCRLCVKSLAGRPYAVFSLFKSKKELLPFGAEVTVYRRGEDVYLNDKKIFSLPDMKLPGLYNAANLSCAAAMSAGIADPDFIGEFASAFPGIPHRTQTVAEIFGVRYLDSSIDSSPARTVTTLTALPCRPIVLLGGRGKGVPFDSLVPILTEKVKGVILMGETGEEIFRLLTQSEDFCRCGAFLRRAGNMEEAVGIAASLALPGDTVILSPASTSFDAYRNFEERGDDFARFVNLLRKG